MNPELQRIAFLEYLGWTNLNRDSKLGNYRALRGTSPDGKKGQITPNPLLDLTIIRKAEKTLTDRQRRSYEHILCRVVGHREQNDPLVEMFDFDLLHASAPQRLETFLRTVDRWSDE